MICEGSSISCGVDQIYGFEDCDPDCLMEMVTEYVAEAVWLCSYLESRYRESGEDTYSAAMYMFSDVVGGLGDRWGELLMEKYPDDVVRIGGTNPNSGNDIITYMWRPSTGKITLPGWARGKKAGIAAGKTRVRW
jgi:hypothetical protein